MPDKSEAIRAAAEAIAAFDADPKSRAKKQAAGRAAYAAMRAGATRAEITAALRRIAPARRTQLAIKRAKRR